MMLPLALMYGREGLKGLRKRYSGFIVSCLLRDYLRPITSEREREGERERERERDPSVCHKLTRRAGLAIFLLSGPSIWTAMIRSGLCHWPTLDEGG